MKNFTLSMIIIFCFSINLSFAQTNNNIKFKKAKQETYVKTNEVSNTIQPRQGGDCLFSDNFSDPDTWVTGYDETACSLEWEIGTGLETGGSYQIATIESTTADNGYAMIDSDEYGGEEGGTEVEDSWFTTDQPIDLANYPNVVLEFETWYRSYNYEKCWVVTSTDGVTWPELTPDSEANPEEGIYEVFPGISGENGTDVGNNPFTKRINISESAGGEGQVWIRFHWTGTWGYAWFIDDVCVVEQPADDLVLNYGVVSHTGTGEEYGRIPQDQVGNTMQFGGEVFNFGINNQSEASLSMNMLMGGNTIISDETGFMMYSVDADGFYSVEETDGMIDSDESVYFQMDVAQPSTEVGMYTVDFAVESLSEMDGSDNFGNNIQSREFEITEDLYSVDGIDVYSDPTITRIGTGSFTDGTDGFMVMTYYEIDQTTDVAGLEIMLDSYAYETPLTVPGGEIIISLKDTADVLASFNLATFPSSSIVESDFYMVTQGDIDDGSLEIVFDSPYTLSPGAYYACVEMYSNNNASDIYILDDETVPQPGGASMIFIPGDAVYSNGTAAGVRMKLGNGQGFDIEEATLNGVSVFPNPSTGIININFENNDFYIVEVSNIIGEIVLVKKISSNTILDLSNYDKGTYLVKVSNSELSKTERVVIE